MHKENLNLESLASTFVGSPDPRRDPPPQGEKLFIEWNIPRDTLEKKVLLFVHLLYKDYTQEVKTFPLEYRHGAVNMTLEGQEYLEKKGFLSYKAELIDLDDQLLYECQHQLWVPLLVP
ncbi:MAG: hypothetical protein KBC64_03285 [Simkaniaceae bacterium]|nr:hypothetical protein [Simkaniaceae bacterium]